VDWQKIGTNVGDTELVEAGYRRLHAKYDRLRERGHLTRNTAFYQWANGHILLTADETQVVFKEKHAEYVDTKFYMFQRVLRHFNEKRLRAAMTYDNAHRRIVTLQLLIHGRD
jgi:hypothetical protein